MDGVRYIFLNAEVFSFIFMIVWYEIYFFIHQINISNMKKSFFHAPELAKLLKENGINENLAEKMAELLYSLGKDFVLGRKDLSEWQNKMYANAEWYDTRKVGPYESHERFIDVQCVVAGEEQIELCPVENLTVSEAYDPSRDIAFYDGKTPCTEKVVLNAGECCVIRPGMGHKPCMDHDGKHFVRKVVFKIPVD